MTGATSACARRARTGYTENERAQSIARAYLDESEERNGKSY